ncbi:hypothetical protein GQR36_18855 [Enterococcus termitis]
MGQIDQKVLKPSIEELSKYFEHLEVEKNIVKLKEIKF